MIKDLCEKLEFPEEATATFENTLHKILGDKYLTALFFQAMDDYFLGDGNTHCALLAEIAEKTGIHIYTAHMAFLLACARPLKYMYRQRGISDEIFFDTLNDLRYKLFECKKMHNIWGTFVFRWFRRFFLCERFKLGRLQYERIAFPRSQYKGVLKEGDTVYNCHIPSAGPLTEESVIASLKQAYSYFEEELVNGIMPVYCNSWLLYPPTAELYPNGSNLEKFYRMFDVIDKTEAPNNPDFWRIFYKDFSAETLATVSAETSLQRIILTYLRAGNTMGSGKAILLFDGEKIIG